MYIISCLHPTLIDSDPKERSLAIIEFCCEIGITTAEQLYAPVSSSIKGLNITVISYTIPVNIGGEMVTLSVSVFLGIEKLLCNVKLESTPVVLRVMIQVRENKVPA